MGNPRRANGHRRNELIKRVRARDTHCWLCREPIDKTLNMVAGKHGPKCPQTGCLGCTPHPRRGEVHEIIPVSRGGSPLSLENCTLTCRRCNQWIGDRTPNELARETRPKPVEVRSAFAW